mgnify:CR=1 FL=1
MNCSGHSLRKYKPTGTKVPLTVYTPERESRFEIATFALAVSKIKREANGSRLPLGVHTPENGAPELLAA